MLFLTWLPFWLPWNTSAFWSTSNTLLSLQSHNNNTESLCLFHTLLDPLKLMSQSNPITDPILFPLAHSKPNLSLVSPSPLCTHQHDIFWALENDNNNNTIPWLAGCFSLYPSASFTFPYFYVGSFTFLFPSYNASFLCNISQKHLYAQWDSNALNIHTALLPNNRFSLQLSTRLNSIAVFNASHPIQFTPLGEPLQLGPFSSTNISSTTTQNSTQAFSWSWSEPFPTTPHSSSSILIITLITAAILTCTLITIYLFFTLSTHQHQPLSKQRLLMRFL
jgi:hypothetical protein